MNLVECQGKELFRSYGITVPRGTLITGKEVTGLSTGDLPQLNYPVMVKAQVEFGGRGKAGGVKEAGSPSELISRLREMLGSDLKGTEVRSVLVEEKQEVLDEIYLAITLDADAAAPLLMAGEKGGVDVESSARSPGGGFFTALLDEGLGLPDYLKRLVAKRLGLSDTNAFGGLLESLYSLYVDEDGLLVEINPLAVTPDGLVALDAKVKLDDGAGFRQRELFNEINREQEELLETELERPQRLARKYGIDYVPLEGEVGLISDGAGTGMLTLDVISDFGGAPANFCEMGGEADADTVAKSMEVVLADPDVSVLLITLIGGLTRMDHMAEGIADYAGRVGVDRPLVIRMCGTKEEVGKNILKEAGVDTFDDHAEAVERAVELSGEGGI